MTFAPIPRDDLDWKQLSSSTPTRGHIESRWNQGAGTWTEPEFVGDPFLRIHGLAPVLHYGQEAYEGLKAFRAPNGEINIVRPEYHARRLMHSSSLVSIPPVPVDHFLKCVQLAVGMNGDYVPPNDANGMLYIRPVVFGTGCNISLDPTDEYLFCVYVTTAGAFYANDSLDALILEEFDRAAPRGTGSGKVGGNYSPVMRWSKKAKAEGYDITLHLDSQTRSEIEEFSTSAFIGVKNDGKNITLVVPDTENVVASVTSDSVQQLAKYLGWQVDRRSIKYEELADFSEVIACGTAVTVISIKSITRKSTQDKFVYLETGIEAGPCAQRLSAMLHDIYKGKEEDPFGWCAKVRRPAGFKEATIDHSHVNGTH
ncbi:branched-chain amino acid aminotransferase ii [Trichoderma arundinaceum]|uniref:Branched-chain amino acid aminotransferase ii n=1 Tax=Trichoderma arundinaceum TaxID=490622 RepID=A0A395NWM4_TRIAR|nr:branched-chain amino acid aminotransferase ii [Trichoderma arundinaceum]